MGLASRTGLPGVTWAQALLGSCPCPLLRPFLDRAQSPLGLDTFTKCPSPGTKGQPDITLPTPLCRELGASPFPTQSECQGGRQRSQAQEEPADCSAFR